VTSALPPLYARWVDQFLGRIIPSELEATCQHCVMVVGGDEAGSPDRRYFDSTTRCCTYLPNLPNFLVGPILADADPSMALGRRSVEVRLGRGVAVTPLGLGTPATYSLLYTNGTDGFGASHTLRCPHHLDDGTCGIWTHRMSVCATWFCKHSRGAVGRRFWRALQVLLVGVEKDLARWCLLELRLGAGALGRLFPPPEPITPSRTIDRFQIDGRVDPEQHAAVWGEWAGRERELFDACGHLVERLGWQEVLEICGPGLQISARLVRDYFDALLSRNIPPRLRVGEFQIHPVSEKTTLVVSYNGYDPLCLQGSLMEALPYFDGRPVADALRAIESEKHLRLDRELLLKLVDFSILVPVPPRSSHRKRA
jgi:hypothetical protein